MRKQFLLLGTFLLLLSSCKVNKISSSSSQSYSSSIELSQNNISSSISTSSSDESSESLSSNDSILSTSISSLSSSNIASSSLSESIVSSSLSSLSTSISNVEKAYVDLSEWKNYLFHDGDSSEMNSDWTYYYNTSKNPNNVVRGDKYGVDLNKDKQRLCSPIFYPWEKVEINIKMRFVPRSSTAYKTIKNKPQLIISCYDENRNKIGSEEIEITKSKIPSSDREFYTLKLDVYNNRMYSFDIEYGNSVEYSGTKWYTYAINEIGLKGWPYSKR